MSDIIEFNRYFNEVFSEYQKRYKSISFGFSKFQIENFVIANQITPGRMYRSVIIELDTRLEAFKYNMFRVKETDINIREMKCKRESETNEFEIERIDLKLLETELSYDRFLKLCNDLKLEIDLLYGYLQKFPENYSQKDLEEQEGFYFRMNLERDAMGLNGGQKSLLNMTDDKANMDIIFSDISLQLSGGVSKHE